MGKRARRRGKEGGGPGAAAGPTSFADLGLDLDLEVQVEEGGAVPRELDGGRGVLTLRTAMSPGTRTEYAAVRRGERSSPSAAREDAWHRAIEFLYERLVVGWEVAGVPTTGQKALLQRLRVATPAERIAIREALRAHLAEHLPDVEAP
ncbi:MAG: hypothetical protein JWM31_1564 [Solirubrobacterales bacterium]|nr:hypothetical protein [Solirubrobacterales bacterium]